MRYFDKGFAKFYLELSKNNNKEWFHAHKSEYDNYVKMPFEKLIGDLIEEISKHEDLGIITPKDCILRINKDIRFSKDKSPYNTHVTAFISRAGAKDKSMPGIFIRLSAESLGIMGGCYCPTPTQIESIRAHIINNQKGFHELKSNSEFIEKFKRIEGESIKRIPDSLKALSSLEPMILNKQWFFVAEKQPDIIYTKELLPEIMNYYFVAKPLNGFLINAIA